MWREKIELLKRMKQWVLDAEHILDGSWAQGSAPSDGGEHCAEKKLLTNQEVGLRFDTFLQDLSQERTKEGINQTQRQCLEEFLRVLHNLRPSLIQCYDVEAFPRTNNEMEGVIRRIKARYRRISGRKNWNIYLLRYGRDVAFYEWWDASPERWNKFEQLASNVDRDSWQQMKKETRSARSEQLKRFRFRHKREVFLATLEQRWATASETASLH
jgi:hypothetical protein